MHSGTSLRALRAVALFEAAKGAIVFGAGFGLLALLHRDVRHVAESLVTRLHLNPEQHHVGLFLAAAEHVTDARLWLLAALAFLYSAVRVAEAWGLWRGRRWGLWLGTVGGAIYVPVELFELARHPTPIKAATLALNVAVVAYLGWKLYQRERAAAAAAAAMQLS